MLIERPKSQPLHHGLEKGFTNPPTSIISHPIPPSESLGGRFQDERSGQSSNEAQYKAVLMDFGSAMPRFTTPSTRQQALDLQEDAGAHCTATYRAPELFDVPTGLTIDLARSDIWSAGCLLFATMYVLFRLSSGQEPISHNLNICAE